VSGVRFVAIIHPSSETFYPTTVNRCLKAARKRVLSTTHIQVIHPSFYPSFHPSFHPQFTLHFTFHFTLHCPFIPPYFPLHFPVISPSFPLNFILHLILHSPINPSLPVHPTFIPPSFPPFLRQAGHVAAVGGGGVGRVAAGGAGPANGHVAVRSAGVRLPGRGRCVPGHGATQDVLPQQRGMSHGLRQERRVCCGQSPCR
jgi:hypothetical protein